MKFSLLLFSCLIFMIPTTQAQPAQKDYQLTWGQLPPIPDQFGFAGSFAGHSHGALIVAGGANFPDGGAPWTGSKKVWSDNIFILDSPTGKWTVAGKLPQPMGYGVSISYGEKLICIGGSNAGGHLATVYAISYLNGKLKIEQWGNLPQTLANSCGTVVGHTIYVAGGLIKPDDKGTANIFWSLSLDDPGFSQWKQLPTWPGPPRMLSVAGQSPRSFFLFSGTDLEDKNGAAHRHYLKDAYAYTPGKGWQKLAELPSAVVAAASPAMGINKKQLLIFGGDDGLLADDAAKLKEQHPGFSDQVLRYDISANTWTTPFRIKTDKEADAATNPNGSTWAPVTTNMVMWQHYLVFPGGEVRPAVRTPRVLTAKLVHGDN